MIVEVEVAIMLLVKGLARSPKFFFSIFGLAFPLNNLLKFLLSFSTVCGPDKLSHLLLKNSIPASPSLLLT